MKVFILALLTGVVLSGCAVLHHVQVGDIDNTTGKSKVPFDIKVSETGVSLQDVKAISRAAVGKEKSKEVEEIANIIALFQMGPHTGNGVYVKDYARNLATEIVQKCPSGQVTGLMSIRETRKYPVISGEIIKVTGYCLQ